MKSPDEIRRHRDNLDVCRQMPCDCRGTVHEERCVCGGMMMRAVSETLSWILGENERMQELVDRIAQDVKDFLRGN